MKKNILLCLILLLCCLMIACEKRDSVDTEPLKGDIIIQVVCQNIPIVGAKIGVDSSKFLVTDIKGFVKFTDIMKEIISSDIMVDRIDYSVGKYLDLSLKGFAFVKKDGKNAIIADSLFVKTNKPLDWNITFSNIVLNENGIIAGVQPGYVAAFPAAGATLKATNRLTIVFSLSQELTIVFMFNNW